MKLTSVLALSALADLPDGKLANLNGEFEKSLDRTVNNGTLSVGKSLHLLWERRGFQGTPREAYNAAGGIGKPHGHAEMARNVFTTLVASEHPRLTEDQFDALKGTHTRHASPIIAAAAKLPDKEREKTLDKLAAELVALDSDTAKKLEAMKKALKSGDTPKGGAGNADESALAKTGDGPEPLPQTDPEIINLGPLAYLQLAMDRALPHLLADSDATQKAAFKAAEAFAEKLATGSSVKGGLGVITVDKKAA